MKLPPEVLAMRNVPTVGAAFKIIASYATVLIRCQCADKAPVLLVGPAVGQCVGCGNRYAISNDAGQTVSQMAREPLLDEA